MSKSHKTIINVTSPNVQHKEINKRKRTEQQIPSLLNARLPGLLVLHFGIILTVAAITIVLPLSPHEMMLAPLGHLVS